MQCSKFRDREAAGVCAYSGKPYCQEELVEIQGKLYGKENLDHVMAELKGNRAGGAPIGDKNRIAAVLFALFLGGLGVHKFYLGQVGQGVLYLIFCWTFIPAIVAFIEGIVYLTMTDEKFAQKYG